MGKIICVPNEVTSSEVLRDPEVLLRRLTSFGIISFLICVIFISSANALSNKISTTFETGERLVTDTIEDRDLSGNLDFYRYRLRLDQEISKSTKYNLWYDRYHKDYETSDNLDSTSNEWHFGIDHTLENFKLSLDMGFRQKDYKNSPTLEYERSNATIGLDYKYEDLWAVNWDNGFINYDYTKEGADQLKLFTKIGGWAKFFDERLKINPAYKFQKIDDDNASKDRTENVFTVIPSYKLNIQHFDKIGGFYSFGRNDTKDYEDDDREDDLRFKYTKWYVNTDHPLTDNLDTFFKYGQTRRDYQNSPNDYRNWLIENRAGYKIYEDKFKKIDFSTQVEHKEATYNLVDTLGYIRNLAGVKFSYKIKNNWELIPSFAFKKYDYSASPTKNEKQYEIKIEFGKEFPLKNLELKLAYKYVWKDYRYKTDIELWSLKAGLEYKF